MKHIFIVAFLIIAVALVSSLCYSPASMTQSYIIPIAHADQLPSVNITSDQNGTVYISINGLSIYNYTRSQTVIGFKNSTHIFVSYTGLYINSPETDLVPVLVYIYNKTDNGSLIEKYVFNATNFTAMAKPYPDTVFMIEYYNVSGFYTIYYKVYNATNMSNPVLIYEGELKPYNITEKQSVLSHGYMAYIATLLPLAILVMLVGRGKIRDIGAGFIIYGVVVLMMPYLGIIPRYFNALSAVSIIIGIILVFMSR